MTDGFLITAPQRLTEKLKAFSPVACRIGEGYFRRGRVTSIESLGPGTHYRTVIQDTGTQTVTLEYEEELGWLSSCTCGELFECPHVYASIKALLAEYSHAQVQRLSGGKTGPSTGTGAAPLPLFAQKVQIGLGRPLTRSEQGFLQRLKRITAKALQSGCVPSFELAALRLKIENRNHYLTRISPFPIRDEQECWNCIAYALERGGHPVPEFLSSVTDLPTIAAKFAQWEVEAEVREWRDRLNVAAKKTLTLPPQTSESHDLRIRIWAESSVLEWKKPGEEAFRRFARTEWDKFEIKYKDGSSHLPMEAALIWSVVREHSIFRGPYERSVYGGEFTTILNRLFRIPALASRLVNAEGDAFARPPDPLRWEVNPPDKDKSHYRIRLITAEGTPLDSFLYALQGEPILYLTEKAIYQAPKSNGQILDPSTDNFIPALALETSEGIDLLQTIGSGIPEPLRNRIQQRPTPVTIQCELVAPSPLVRTEECRFNVTAEVSTGEFEVWDGDVWRPREANSGSEKQEPREPGGTITWYDQSNMRQIPPLLATLGVSRSIYSGNLTVRVTKKFPQLFVDWLRSVPNDIHVQLEGELQSLAQGFISGTVKLDVNEVSPDWFDLKVVLNVSETQLTPEEIQLLLNAKGAYVRLKGKGWKRLQFDVSNDEEDQLARLGLNAKEFTAEPQRLHVLQLADPAARRFLPEEQVAQVQRRARDLVARVTPDIPMSVKAELRPYQLAGFHFLAYLTENRFGGILADDMGLGKTLQTLTWLVWLRERNHSISESTESPPRASLVVCPKSVMENWRAETEKFTASLRVKVWTSGEQAVLEEHFGQSDLHVINYSQLRNWGANLRSVRWEAVILDEGQYIKNPHSQTAQIARSLHAVHRLVLTGTPIENRLLDLWSLMAFAMPGMLGSRAQFAKLYDDKEDPFARRRLASRVRPFLLRRTKSQVARDLPDRIEEDLLCELEGEQKSLYLAELKHAQQILLRLKTQKELAGERFNFLTALLRLRQICCCPRLVNPKTPQLGSKIEALLEQLEPLMEEGHKVLIFSQFVELITLVHETLRHREWPLFCLTGATENRGQLVDRFQQHNGAAIFLISLKAGGFGLNLTAASYVVLFDPWWNPAVENQAIDRTHRIGQKNKVIAYRLLMKGSIEEKIRILQKQKAALMEDVLGEEKFAQSLSIEDLQFLLQS